MVGLGVVPVVVETDDAVLIADRAKAQEIKTVVKQLEAAAARRAGAPQDLSSLGPLHRRHRRSPLAVKRISVKPGVADAPPPGRALDRGARNGHRRTG